MSKVINKVIISRNIDSYILGQKIVSNHFEIKGNPPFVDSIKEICVKKS